MHCAQLQIIKVGPAQADGLIASAMASLEYPKAVLRGIIGWSVAGALLLVFPLVVPCMCLLRAIRRAVRSPRNLKGSVVVITGASSGIGSNLALDFAKHGAKLVLVARREGRLRQVADECLENGALDAAVCPADCTKEEDCRKAVEFAVSTFGRVDVLVNNAGVAHSGLFEDYDDTTEFQRTMELDFWGAVVTTKYALEHLRRTRGHVVVTCSVGAYVPYPRQSLYNASKGAVLQFFDTLRTEPIGRVIDITVAMPGFVESEMTKGGPEGHIPWWWPMLPTAEASKAIVEAMVSRKRYAILPWWYATWLPYRLFAPELMEWLPRMFLLGRPTNMLVEVVCNALLGERNTQKLFGTLARLFC